MQQTGAPDALETSTAGAPRQAGTDRYSGFGVDQATARSIIWDSTDFTFGGAPIWVAAT